MPRPPLSFSAAGEQSLDMKISNVIMQFRRAGDIFFHKVISRSAATECVPGPWAYALEFPYPFVHKHGELFKFNVTFERRNCDRRWPIKLTLQEFKLLRTVQLRVFAYGQGGWKNFLMDNKIQVGDVVFFIWLEKSRFVVQTLEESLKNVDGASPARRPEPAVSLSLHSKCTNPNKCQACGFASPCPLFVVTVRPSHASPVQVENEEKESLKESLEVPGRFWESHRRMLRGDVLRLQGPNSKAVVMVKAVRKYHLEGEQEPKLSVTLERGWKTFLDANRLQLGDTLQFSLVEPLCFKVDLLDLS